MARDIVLVGCGNMGFAMLSGWIAQGGDAVFHVVEPDQGLQKRALSVGAHAVASIDDLGDVAPDLVFLAIKPQVMAEVAPAYGRFGGAAFVSVAAGVTCASLRDWLGADAGIIRTMPNTPAAIGEGMMVSFANPHVTAAQKAAVDGLLSASGQTGWIEDEGLMDAVTAISGSGPAYVFHFIECLSQSAVDLGLAPDLAQKLALQTVAGAGLLARGSETSPGVLREQVTSPGGTTAAALDVFMGRLGPLIDQATTAARDRGAELGRG